MSPYQIALTMIPKVGNKGVRKLAELYPDVEDIFKLSHEQLKELFGNHKALINAIEQRTTLGEAERTVRELEQKHIKTLFFNEKYYPQRMNRPGCEDCPALLYMIGDCDLNAEHSVAVVGTRKATVYGRETTAKVIGQMASDRVLIVSGLAYGIDTEAHTAAVANGLPTVGVLGHGLDRIYPEQNRDLARRMLASGGALVTEFPLGTAISSRNFPARNRIIAAMCDATVVVEAAEHGGALITANMAIGYNREVFAVPGYLDAPYSIGCNTLIANNKASLLRNAGDIYYQMGWNGLSTPQSSVGEQQALFVELSPDERRIADLLQEKREMTLDEIAAQSGFPMHKAASTVFEMESRNIIRCLPGKIYKAI